MSTADEIIKKNGNKFHADVTSTLRDKGWKVTVSPYYKDYATEKSREVDIIAEKAFPLENPHGQFFGRVFVRLLVECKYVNKTTVFWFDNLARDQAENLVVNIGEFKKGNTNTAKHHWLLHEEVAKLFASGPSTGTQGEQVYGAINQVLSAMVYFRGTPSTLPESQMHGRKYYFEYPVILCNSFDKLHKTDMNSEEAKPLNEDSFLIEVNYAYKNPHRETNAYEYFLIDVANFAKLEEYLGVVEDDVKLMGSFMY